MLRQLFALLALIAGLTALPASAEVRLPAQGDRQVELAASAVSAAREGLSARFVPAGPSDLATGVRAAIAVPGVAAAAPLSVRIGIDRARE